MHDVRDGKLNARRDAQRVLVRPDALDIAHRTRPEPGAGAIGDAEVHRHTDQRDVEAAEIGKRRRIGTVRRGEQRRDVGERPLPALGVAEDLRSHRGEFRIEDVAALGVGVFAVQGGEFV